MHYFYLTSRSTPSQTTNPVPRAFMFVFLQLKAVIGRMYHLHLAVFAILLGFPFTTAPSSPSSLLTLGTEDLVGLGQC